MKNDIRLKLNLSFLYIRQLTRHSRTSGPTGLTVLEIFASVLANPFFHPDGLIISTAVKYARLFIFHFILGNKISDAYRVSLCLHKIVSVTVFSSKQWAFIFNKSLHPSKIMLANGTDNFKVSVFKWAVI